MMTTRPFQSSFSAPSFDEWRALVEGNGRALSQLTTKTAGDLEIEPLYPPGEPRTARASRPDHRNGWLARPRYRQSDLASATETMARHAHRGSRASWLVVARDGTGGLSLDRASDLDALLDAAGSGHDLLFDVGAQLPSAVAERRDRLRADDLGGSLGIDPFEQPSDATLAAAVREARWCLDSAPSFRALLITTRRWQEAGASPAVQLAAAAAGGVSLLRTLTEDGLDVNDAARQLLFQFAVGPDLFVETAKLRAARAVWKGIVAAAGGTADATRMELHVTSSARSRTKRAPYLNLLRGTTEGAAAVFGGADSITILPFDDAVGASNETAERLAWNTHVLLAEESHLGVVADPAGGSGAVEALTDAIARDAWTLFQSIEKEGGLIEAIRSGRLAARIEESNVAEKRAVRRRRPRIVGVSDFVRIDEPALERAAASSTADRLAAPFETLRDEVDAMNRPPVVFVATIGHPRETRLRERFAIQFLAVAGIATDDASAPSESVADAADRFGRAGRTIALLVMDDERREKEQAAAVAALVEAGAEQVLVAGRPLDDASGPEVVHLYEGCDVVDVLGDLVRRIGATS